MNSLLNDPFQHDGQKSGGLGQKSGTLQFLSLCCKAGSYQVQIRQFMDF